MAKKSPRVIPGLVTLVGEQLRIINGNVESLKRPGKPGRPKKLENLIPVKLVSIPEFPDENELRESGIRDGFRLIRHRDRKEEITRKNRSLQAKFDDLCSEVRILDPFSWEHAEVEARFNSGKVSRIERSVPSSFCSCDQSEEDEIPCLVHGLKRDDCDCGGINGITGYRMCYGHRQTGHIIGVSPKIMEARKNGNT